MQIIIEKRKAQIVWPDAVGTVFIHPQRGQRARLCLQLLIKRSEAAVKAHHQRQVLACRQLYQSLGILNVLRQGLIHTDVNTGIQQFADHLIVRCR